MTDPICDRCGNPKSRHQDVMLFCPFYSTFRSGGPAPSEPAPRPYTIGPMHRLVDFTPPDETVFAREIYEKGYRAFLDAMAEWAKNDDPNMPQMGDYLTVAITAVLRGRAPGGDPAPPPDGEVEKTRRLLWEAIQIIRRGTDDPGLVEMRLADFERALRGEPPAEDGPTEVAQAEHNIAFLEAHPEYENVFSYGVLTRRIGKSQHYENFRYFELGDARVSPRTDTKGAE